MGWAQLKDRLKISRVSLVLEEILDSKSSLDEDSEEFGSDAIIKVDFAARKTDLYMRK